MGQLWIPMLALALYQYKVLGQVIHDSTCNLYVASFDRVMRGRLDTHVLPFAKNKEPTVPLSLAKCASRCAHYRGGKCASINYKNGTMDGCELLATDYWGNETLFKPEPNWLHYGADPSERFVSFLVLFLLFLYIIIFCFYCLSFCCISPSFQLLIRFVQAQSSKTKPLYCLLHHI